MALTKISRSLLDTGISDSSDATAITIDSSENVGIGTSSPDAILETSASATGNTVGALLTNTNQSGTADSVSLNFGLGRTVDSHIFSIPVIKFLKEQQWTSTGSTVNSALVFNTIGSESTSERMRIQSGGNVLLNQTATADSGVADGRLEITRGSQHCINCHVAGTGNSTLVAFINDNGFVGGINTNGSATVYNTSSDARLKNVLGEAKGLEVVNALNPVNFEWKSDGKIQDGLIAQEVEKVFPDAVSEPELEGEWYSVDYSKLVTPLIKAMQEQQAQIEALQSEINILKGE